MPTIYKPQCVGVSTEIGANHLKEYLMVTKLKVNGKMVATKSLKADTTGPGIGCGKKVKEDETALKERRAAEIIRLRGQLKSTEQMYERIRYELIRAKDAIKVMSGLLTESEKSAQIWREAAQRADPLTLVDDIPF